MPLFYLNSTSCCEQSCDLGMNLLFMNDAFTVLGNNPLLKHHKPVEKPNNLSLSCFILYDVNSMVCICLQYIVGLYSVYMTICVFMHVVNLAA